MKKILLTFLIGLSLPLTLLAAPTSWDFSGGILKPQNSQSTAEVRVANISATDASATSTLPKLSISNILSFGGKTGNSWNDFCVNITGGSGLCDGTDDVGSGTVTSVALSTPTGLSIAGSPITTTGTLALSLTSGYNIPLNASTTNWNTAYNWGDHASAGYITDGNTNWDNSYGFVTSADDTVSGTELDGVFSTTGLLKRTGAGTYTTVTDTSHSAVTLSGTLDYITLVGQDIVRGAIDLAADITGILPVANGGTGASSLTNLITLATHTTGDFIATITGTANEITVTGSGGENAGVTLSLPTSIDLGGKTSFEIPNGTAPTVDATGECALDTTDDQLKCADSAGTARVFAHDEFRVVSVTVASTSLAFTSGQTLAALSHKDGIEITQFRCYVVGGTSKVINLTDGTNDTETITCATTITSDTDVATNDTFTADELGYIEFGASSGSPNYLHFEAWGRITAE